MARRYGTGVGAVAFLLLGVGCTTSSDPSAPSCGEAFESSACSAEVAEHPIEGADHVADCSDVSYGTNPPSSGTHYFTWAAFGNYQQPLPRGFWVHALEHGAVVFSYRDVGTDVTAAEELVAELSDPDCGSAPRVILTPDPKLDVPWAASAWGHTLRADCFERAVFECFFDANVGNGPEQVCAAGKDFRQPDGTLDLPVECDNLP